MSDTPSEELQRLRRAAFGRDATQADLDAWAAVSTVRPASDEAAMDSEVAPRVDAAEDALPQTIPPTTAPRRARQGVILAVLVAITLAAGYGIGWAVISRQASSLRIFDQPATSDDHSSIFDFINSQPLSGDAPTQILGDQRLLHKDSEFTAWASLGSENTGPGDETWSSMVCVAVEFIDGSATARCSSLEEFSQFGVSVPSPLDGDDRVFTWGPTGPLSVAHTEG